MRDDGGGPLPLTHYAALINQRSGVNVVRPPGWPTNGRNRAKFGRTRQISLAEIHPMLADRIREKFSRFRAADVGRHWSKSVEIGKLRSIPGQVCPKLPKFGLDWLRAAQNVPLGWSTPLKAGSIAAQVWPRLLELASTSVRPGPTSSGFDRFRPDPDQTRPGVGQIWASSGNFACIPKRTPLEQHNVHTTLNWGEKNWRAIGRKFLGEKAGQSKTHEGVSKAQMADLVS